MSLNQIYPRVLKITKFFLVGSAIQMLFIWVIPAHAQSNDDDLYCPIQGSIMISDYTDLSVSNQLNTKVKIINDTNFVMSDVSVAIALYNKDVDLVPAFLGKTLGKYLMLPGRETEVDISFLVDTLPEGEYIMKLIPVQNDKSDFLGDVILKSKDIKGVKLYKSGVDDKNISLTISINNNTFIPSDKVDVEEYSDIAIDIDTKNDSTEPLLRGEVIGVLAQGDVPLGAASFAGVVDRVKLLPGGTRTTSFKNLKTPAGEYTVYAALISPNMVLPVKSLAVKVGQDTGPQSWPYLSKIGVTDYPLKENSEIITCFGYIGESEAIHRLLEPVAVELTVGNEAGIMFTEKKNNTDTEANDFLVFFPKLASGDFKLTAEFLQQRYQVTVSEDEDGNLIDNIDDRLSVVSTLSRDFKCLQEDSCFVPERKPLVYYEDFGNKPSLWFYAGITLVALMLFALIMTRVISEKKLKTKTESNKKE